jgi:hypothetical protein
MIKITRRRQEERPHTIVVSAAKACADCALRKGPECPDCMEHALRGFGLVHRTPIVRH